MSDYAYLLEQLRQAQSAVSDLEAALALEPGDAALELDLISMRRSARKFENELLNLSSQVMFDICRYRIISPGSTSFSISGVTTSLKGFQDLFTLIYYAVTSTKPPRVARVPASIVAQSELSIGWTFSGSLGIVLTIGSAKTLFDAKFDSTVAELVKLLDIRSQSDVRESAQRTGLATVRKAFEWAVSNNYTCAYSVDLKWRNTNLIEKGRYIEKNDFIRMAEAIGLTSDISKDIVSYNGILVGGDIMIKRFHFVDTEDRDYRGVISADVLVSRMELGGRYKARLLVERIQRYAAEEEDRSYTLLSLEPEEGA
jgi:hypothetical protein